MARRTLVRRRAMRPTRADRPARGRRRRVLPRSRSRPESISRDRAFVPARTDHRWDVSSSTLHAFAPSAPFDVLLQSRQSILPEDFVLLRPLRDVAQWAGRQLIDPLPAIIPPAALAYQARFAQHAQVARY